MADHPPNLLDVLREVEAGPLWLPDDAVVRRLLSTGFVYISHATRRHVTLALSVEGEDVLAASRAPPT